MSNSLAIFRCDQPMAAQTGMAIRLLGVVAAGNGRQGYAVVEFEPKRIIAARGGDDLIPGIRLAEVHPDHVVLERNGTRETLAWPEKKTSTDTAAQRINK